MAVYPGLRFNGSLVTFSSSPPGAAVYLDGRFAGTTPVTTRTAAGRRTVLLSKEHFQPREEQLEVGGRLLLSWPFPRRASHHLALRIEDPSALARAALLDLAQSPAIARIVTDAATDLANPDVPPELAYRFLHNAMLLIEDQAGLAALLAAHGRLSSGGRPFAAPGLQQLLRDLARLDSEYPGLALWFAALLPARASGELVATSWYETAVRHHRMASSAAAAATSPAAPPAPVIEAAGMVFHRIPVAAT